MAKKKAKKAARKVGKSSGRRAASASAKKPVRVSPAGKTRSKSEVYSLLADHAGITKKQAAAVFEGLTGVIGADLSKRGPGVVMVPGLMKVVVQRKPATKARKGINPFTGEQTVFKAKPARNVVKVRPMKGLKDLVA